MEELDTDEDGQLDIKEISEASKLVVEDPKLFMKFIDVVLEGLDPNVLWNGFRGMLSFFFAFRFFVW